jgi:hypothetical protein
MGRDGERHCEEIKLQKPSASDRKRSLYPNFMKPINVILMVAGGAILVLALLVLFGFNFLKDRVFSPTADSSSINNFEQCVAAGNAILESYPRQCKTSDGKNFTEDIGNALEKQNLIRVFYPMPNDLVKSPLTVKGEARGTWFSETSFPVKIFDANGVQLGLIPAQAKPDWTTQDFVEFEAVLDFQTPATATGTLVMEKDNPSGLPENTDELRIPVRFGK